MLEENESKLPRSGFALTAVCHVDLDIGLTQRRSYCVRCWTSTVARLFFRRSVMLSIRPWPSSLSLKDVVESLFATGDIAAIWDLVFQRGGHSEHACVDGEESDVLVESA